MPKKSKQKSAPFKRFGSEEIVSKNLVKSSVRRGIRKAILDQYGDALDRDAVDEFLPPKCNLCVFKCTNNIQMIANENVPLFYNIRGGPFLPTLRLLHQFPELLPKWQVDTGAIRFVISGANIMSPGFTSEGGLKDEKRSVKNVALKVGDVVSVYAEDREHALAVGIVKKSSEEIVETNEGVAVENIHYLGDELWTRQVVSA